MMELTTRAPAKLNLTLDILRRRADGYHDLEMVMISVDLCDQVHVRLRPDGRILVRAPGTDLPEGEDNLAGRAARAFFHEQKLSLGAEITLEKHIPSQAGMAGGSSDAAAVLRALRSLTAPELPLRQLETLGAEIGSDVPYCVRGGATMVRGRGELLSDLPPLPACCIAVCKPDFGLSTPALFGRVRVDALRRRPNHDAMHRALREGDLSAAAAEMVNVFEEVLTPEEAACIRAIREEMLANGAENARMTGSGPTVFGLFRREEDAARACQALRSRWKQTFLTRPLAAGAV